VWVAIDLWPQARSASLPAWVPDWLVGSVGRPFLFGVVVAAAWWASNALVRWIWRMWVRYEQRAVLAHTSPGGAAVFALTGMGMVWWGVFRLGHMLRSKGDLSALFVDPFEAVAPVAGLALLSALVLYWWRPPPKPPPEETADANAKTG
jgi:hypothetical protein